MVIILFLYVRYIKFIYSITYLCFLFAHKCDIIVLSSHLCVGGDKMLQSFGKRHTYRYNYCYLRDYAGYQLKFTCM